MLTEVCIKPRSSNEIAEAGGKWDIPRTELDMGTELGRGNFGIVLKGSILFLENVHRQNNIDSKSIVSSNIDQNNICSR